MTFFCGGSRNFDQFLDLFDRVFVLEVDLETLNERLSLRSRDAWGGRASEREMIARLHATREDIPSNGVTIDATRPVTRVVEEILAMAQAVRDPIARDRPTSNSKSEEVDWEANG